MLRRQILPMLGGITVCSLGTPSWAASEGTAHWGYGAKNGPGRWAEIAPAFRACGKGREQSPIDLRHAIRSKIDALEIRWLATPLAVMNTGHAIQVPVTRQSMLMLEGKWFRLRQFHFHRPSEHRMDGQPFGMEAHFVHDAEDGTLAVVGVMMREGASHAALQSILERIPASPGKHHAADGRMIDPMAFLPRERSYYRYAGSLTTPPCSEIVHWAVLTQPIEVSAEQIAQYGELYAGNARPIQPVHRRFLLRSF